jgi:hypothetical protein
MLLYRYNHIASIPYFLLGLGSVAVALLLALKCTELAPRWTMITLATLGSTLLLASLLTVIAGYSNTVVTRQLERLRDNARASEHKERVPLCQYGKQYNFFHALLRTVAISLETIFTHCSMGFRGWQAHKLSSEELNAPGFEDACYDFDFGDELGGHIYRTPVEIFCSTSTLFKTLHFAAQPALGAAAMGVMAHALYTISCNPLCLMSNSCNILCFALMSGAIAVGACVITQQIVSFCSSLHNEWSVYATKKQIFKGHTGAYKEELWKHRDALIREFKEQRDKELTNATEQTYEDFKKKKALKVEEVYEEYKQHCLGFNNVYPYCARDDRTIGAILLDSIEGITGHNIRLADYCHRR